MTIYPSNIRGKVSISGSKNASLPIIAASLVNSEFSILKNVPNIKDLPTEDKQEPGLNSEELQALHLWDSMISLNL